MADPGYNGEIEIDAGQTTTFEELAHVTNANVDLLRNMIESSEFNQQGVQRTGGRVDFTLSVDINFDLAETSHQSILDAIRNDELVDVRVYPDRGDTSNRITATCRVESHSISIDGGGVVTASVSLANADGSRWAYATA